MKVHYNTIKRATAHGLQLVHAPQSDTFFVFRIADEGNPNATALASAADPKDALDLAILRLAEVPGNVETNDVKPVKAPKAPKPRKAKRVQHPKAGDDDMDFTDEGDEGEDDEGKSVVKRKYKSRYRPHKMTCGDELAQHIRKEFMTVKDPDTKKPRLDWKRFTAFAKANGCWSAEYLKLNAGMRRMNVVNRLRAKVNDGHEIVWSV